MTGEACSATKQKARKSHFMANLPCHSKENFSRFCREAHTQTLSKAMPYVVVRDHPMEQVIVTEKTHILQRFLHHRWTKSSSQSSVISSRAPAVPSTSAPATESSSRKRRHFSPVSRDHSDTPPASDSSSSAQRRSSSLRVAVNDSDVPSTSSAGKSPPKRRRS